MQNPLNNGGPAGDITERGKRGVGMRSKIVIVVAVALCMGLCLGGLVAKPKQDEVAQIAVDRAEFTAGFGTRDNVHMVVKANMLISLAQQLIADGDVDRANGLMQQVLRLDLPSDREGQKIMIETNLVFGEIYSFQPATGLHKSIDFYSRAFNGMQISEDSRAMVSTLNAIAAIQTTLGNDAEAASLKTAADDIMIGIAPAPLNVRQRSAVDGPGDDDCGTAVSVGSTSTTSMDISPAGDHNWVTFSLAAETNVTIETTTTGDPFSFDTDMNLYGGCAGAVPSDFIEFDEDDGDGFLSIITRCLPAGDYYVEVGGWLDSTPVPTFDLEISESACLGVDEYEPDYLVCSDDFDNGCDTDADCVAGTCSFLNPTHIGFRNNGVGQGNQFGRDNSQIQTDKSIYPGGDWDLLDFDLSRANFVRLETLTDGDSIAAIWNPAGWLTAVNDDWIVLAGPSRLEVCIPARNNWLGGVLGFSLSDEFFYDVALDVEHPCAPFETEPNDTCDADGVQELEVGVTAYGLQEKDGMLDDDYYWFTLEEDSLIRLETDGYDGSRVDTLLELYVGCPDETLIASDDDGGVIFMSLIQGIASAGTYYVNVDAWPLSSPNVVFPYELNLTVTEAPNVEAEPNDACVEANPAALGDNFLASIGFIGDHDNFLLNVPADGFVNIVTSGPRGDTVLQVQNADGSVVVGCDDDGGDGLFSAWGCCLAAGDYCVTVKDFGDNSTIGQYSIDFADAGACTPSGGCPVTGLGCPF